MGELVVVAGGGGLALRARQPRNREFLFLLLGIGVSRPDPHGEASVVYGLARGQSQSRSDLFQVRTVSVRLVAYLSRDVAPLGDQSGSIEDRRPWRWWPGDQGEETQSRGGHDRLSARFFDARDRVSAKRERERERERRWPGEDRVSTEGLTHRLVRDASVHVRLVWAGGLVVTSLEFLLPQQIAYLFHQDEAPIHPFDGWIFCGWEGDAISTLHENNLIFGLD